jgi:RNA polymerase sigma-70 factor, ECF subfamily
VHRKRLISGENLRTCACRSSSRAGAATALRCALRRCAHAYPARAEAEDLVQETCVRALRAEATLRPNSQLKSWFFTILRNVFLNQRRQAPTRAAMLAIDAEETSELAWQQHRGDDPDSLFLKNWEREQVQIAVASLPALYREILVLREWEDLSYEEIAQILGCPLGTVMSRLSRAREKLKSALHSSFP